MRFNFSNAKRMRDETSTPHSFVRRYLGMTGRRACLWRLLCRSKLTFFFSPSSFHPLPARPCYTLHRDTSSPSPDAHFSTYTPLTPEGSRPSRTTDFFKISPRCARTSFFFLRYFHTSSPGSAAHRMTFLKMTARPRALHTRIEAAATQVLVTGWPGELEKEDQPSSVCRMGRMLSRRS